jgi:hypothetical protein
MSENKSEHSILTVVVLLMLAIAAFGWAFAAASYAHAEENWGSGAGRRSMGAFVGNAFKQLPNMPQVIAFTFSKRLWLAIVFLVLEGLAILAGLGMKKLENDWNKPPKRRY